MPKRLDRRKEKATYVSDLQVDKVCVKGGVGFHPSKSTGVKEAKNLSVVPMFNSSRVLTHKG